MTQLQKCRRQLKSAYSKYAKLSKELEKAKQNLHQAKDNLESHVKNKFNQLDTSNDGSLSMNEYMAGLLSYDKSLNTRTLKKFLSTFEKSDRDNSNSISLDEAIQLQYHFANMPYLVGTIQNLEGPIKAQSALNRK
mgnify:CR=1 FL=1